MENPFAGLRPEMRSEHDEIRKGIFSRVLLNMQVSPLEERREWCKAIRATHAAAQAPRQKRAAGASGAPAIAAASSSPPPPPSPSTTSSPLSVVGTKRSHAEAEAESCVQPSTSIAVNDLKESERAPESAGEETSAPVLPTADATTAASAISPGPLAATTAIHQVDGEVEGEEKEAESEASVNECIAAYLRSLIDRVVGLSLESLNVPALRILCLMVGISSEKRSKGVLYNNLSSFYYTNCAKLGKRVSRDTVFERHVEQDVAMLRHATAASPSSKRSTEKAAPSATESGHASASTARSSGSAAQVNKGGPAAVVVSVTSKRDANATAVKAEKGEKAASPTTTTAPRAASAAKPHKTTQTRKKAEDEEDGVKAELSHYLKYEHATEEWEDDVEVAPRQGEHPLCSHTSAYGELDEGEVVFQDRVFSRPGDGRATAAAAASASSHMAKYAASDSEDAWSVPMLERKVASIVQLHDPVTVSIVVKKLSQLGYHAPDAETVVQQMLRRFHERQLIFYDNGIAYLM